MNLTDTDIDRIATAVAAKLKADEKRTYTLKQAAEALNLSHWTVRRMLDDGKLHRIPGTAKPIIPASEITKLLTYGR